MTREFYCKNCSESRYIGEGEGSGRVKMQCARCRAWQWVKLEPDEPENKKCARIPAMVYADG